MVRNFNEIRKNLSKKHHFESESVELIDSEVIPHLFEENLMVYDSDVKARERVFEIIEGNNTAVLLSISKARRQLHVLHKGKTRGMHMWRNEKGEIIFCSRERLVQQFFGHLIQEHKFKKEISIERQESAELQRTYGICTRE